MTGDGVYKALVVDLELEGAYPLDISLELGTILGDDMLPEWEGPYSIRPMVSEQNFGTKHKKMMDNLTVERIPYVEVVNPSGGSTATIG